MRIQKITIEGFRGFNEKQTIHLDHDIVLIYGLNGSGKSSLVEALEWLFFEDISRRDRSACPSEYMSNYLRNVHYVGPGNPFVEATVLLNGVRRVVRKELVGVRGQCCYVDGAEIEDFSCLGVSLESHSKPILSQGEIRSFVDTEQKARWEEISSILGLKVFAELRADLQSLRSRIQNRDQYQKALEQRDAVLVRLRNKGWLTTVVDVVSQTPYNHPQVLNALEEALSDSLGRDLDLKDARPIIKERREAILKKVREPEALKLLELQALGLPETKAADLLSDIRAVIDGFEELNAQSVDQEYVRFLHLGLSLLSNSTCPFCQENTVTEAKERQLRERLASDQITLKAIEKLESQVREIRRNSKKLDESMTGQVPDVARLGVAATKLQEKQLWHSDGAEVQALIEQDLPAAEGLIRETGLALRGLQHTFTNLLHAQTEFKPIELRKEADTVQHKLSAAMASIREIRERIDEVRSSIVSKTKDLSEDEKSEFEFLGYVSELIGLLEFFRTAGAYERRLEVLTRLIESAEVFEKHKTAELLDTLSGEVRRYYEKLNPAEAVQFREIVPSSGKSRQVRLKAESYGEELNPVTCFSEAHMNSLGISLYFPQRVDHNPEWAFAMLDDPIQSMDDDHSNALIDILQEHQNSKQIILLSHSRRFCNTCETRFGKENLLRYEFVHGGEAGPKVSLKEGPVAVLLTRAEALAHGCFEDRRTAGGHLRRAVERFFVEYLAKKGQDRTDLFRLQKHKLMKRARNNAGLPKGDWRDINSILLFADPAAHGQDPKDVKPGEIVWGIEKLEELMEKHNVPA